MVAPAKNSTKQNKNKKSNLRASKFNKRARGLEYFRSVLSSVFLLPLPNHCPLFFFDSSRVRQRSWKHSKSGDVVADHAAVARASSCPSAPGGGERTAAQTTVAVANHCCCVGGSRWLRCLRNNDCSSPRRLDTTCPATAFGTAAVLLPLSPWTRLTSRTRPWCAGRGRRRGPGASHGLVTSRRR